MDILRENRVTLTCPRLPPARRLPVNCTLMGHWMIRRHDLKRRVLAESVIVYCVAGDGWVRLGGEWLGVKAGEVFCCPEGVEHGYGCNREGWEIHWVHFDGAAVRPLLKQAGFTRQNRICRVEHDTPLLNAFSRLRTSLKSRDVRTPYNASARLYGLLLTLVKSRIQAGGPSLVEEIPDDCTCLDDLAARSGYSKYHYCRLFKAQTGCSPWQYVTERKLERARELLLATQLSVKEIAFQLGFNTPDYFARLFARYTGVTPSQYRGHG